MTALHKQTPQESLRELRRRVAEADAPTTQRLTYSAAVEELHTCKKSHLFRFAYVPEHRFTELAELMTGVLEPTGAVARRAKSDMEKTFAAAVEPPGRRTCCFPASAQG